MLHHKLLTSSPAVAAAFIVATAPLVPAHAEGRCGEILWDSFGVPHIYAKSEEAAFYGFGYAQAKSHGNLLLHIYGESRGRAAEYWGAKFEARDKWIVANDIPERSRVWFDAQTPQMRADLEAFAAGVNDYAAAHRDTLSPDVLQVLPLTGVDVIQHAHRLMNYEYVASPARALVEPKTNTAGASNAWAVAPSRSATGKTMLLANPHLPWEPSELTYYEAHINAPGMSIYGATQVGLPVLRFGFNRNLGFTNTVNRTLGFTSYHLTLAPGGYMFDGKVLPFKSVTKSYKVRHTDGSLKTVTFEQRAAIQGPVFDLPGATKSTIGLRVAGLDRPGALQQYLDMGKASNWKEFKAALRKLQVPTFNITYADRDGHILYLHNGIIPRHSDGDYETWSKPVAGDTSKTLWTDVHNYDDLPKVFDPPSGYVQNANDPPWTSTWPRVLDPKAFPAYFARPGPTSLRAQSSNLLLSNGPKISFENFLAKKLSTSALMAQRLLPQLLTAAANSTDPDIKAAVKVLSGWDYHYESDAKGALLFETWARLFSPDDWRENQQIFAVEWTLDDPLATPRGLKDPAAAVAMLKAAVEKTRTLYGAIDRPFGDVSRFHIGDVNLPGNGGVASTGVFRAINWGPMKNGERTPADGETWVSIVEFGTPMKALGVMSYGNSSQPGSKHNSDQLRFVASKTFRTLWLDRNVIEKHLEETDSLDRASAAGLGRQCR